MGNLPHVQRIPKSLEYFPIYALGMAYVEHPQQTEAPLAFRRKLYETLRTTKLTTNKPIDVRIVLFYPTTDWDRIWSNLHATCAADAIKANWLRVIHVFLPTNERLYTIHLTDSVLCSKLGERYTIMHKITECGEGRVIWEWTRKLVAWILRMDPVCTPHEWTRRPQFHIWPPRRNRVVIWIIAQMVFYRVHEIRTPSALEYLEFLRRVRWKAYQVSMRGTRETSFGVRPWVTTTARSYPQGEL
jgi:hypothetical protein